MKRLAALLLMLPALAVADISFVASGAKAGGTTGTSMAPALPAGVTSGDVVIAIAGARETAYAMSTSTTGWTSKYEGSTGNLRYGVWWMRYTGSETAPTITRSTGAQAWVGYTFAMRGVVASGDPFDAASTWTQVSASSPFTTTSTTSATDNSWAVAVFISGGGGSLPVQTISTGSITTTTNLLQNQTQSATTNRIVIGAYRGSAGLGSSGTSTGTQAITWTNTTSNYSGGAILVFKWEPVLGYGGMMGFWP